MMPNKSIKYLFRKNMTVDENFFIYVASALGLILIILFFWIWRLEKRIKNILGSKKAGDLEVSILDSHRRLKDLESSRENILKDLDNKERRIRRSVQAVKTIRFNPFKGTGDGGNQSFSSALLDEKGNGVVFTSIYSRERISIYAKPVENFRGEFELTDEEREAVNKAQSEIRSKN